MGPTSIQTGPEWNFGAGPNHENACVVSATRDQNNEQAHDASTAWDQNNENVYEGNTHFGGTKEKQMTYREALLGLDNSELSSDF